MDLGRGVELGGDGAGVCGAFEAGGDGVDAVGGRCTAGSTCSLELSGLLVVAGEAGVGLEEGAVLHVDATAGLRDKLAAGLLVEVAGEVLG